MRKQLRYYQELTKLCDIPTSNTVCDVATPIFYEGDSILIPVMFDGCLVAEHKWVVARRGDFWTAEALYMGTEVRKLPKAVVVPPVQDWTAKNVVILSSRCFWDGSATQHEKPNDDDQAVALHGFE